MILRVGKTEVKNPAQGGNFHEVLPAACSVGEYVAESRLSMGSCVNRSSRKLYYEILEGDPNDPEVLADA